MDELRSALELATDEELNQLAEVLFRPKFNPLDYWQTPTPTHVCSRHRQEQLALIEQRFRFLAADGRSVLQGRSHRFPYREVLCGVCDRISVPWNSTMSAEELEAEVFLTLVEQAWQRLSPGEQHRLRQEVIASVRDTAEFQALPKLLQENPLALAAKGAGAVAVSAVLRPWLLGQIARQLSLYVARRELARQALLGGGRAALQLQGRLSLAVANRGVALTAATYGTTRALLAWAGPALWGWFLADLGWRAIATNHSRVIPAVFILAQIRLLRTPVTASSATVTAHCC